MHHGRIPRLTPGRRIASVPAMCAAAAADGRACAGVQGGSVEEAARDARYAAFADMLAPGAELLLAHHRDDQLETLMFRLMRGRCARLERHAGAVRWAPAGCRDRCSIGDAVSWRLGLGSRDWTGLKIRQCR
ncbi:ATP-binding protein [Halopseudomonas pachastrellae]|nr:ATP-binding protein [Halopseudomonas pachastrellae]